MGFLQAQDPIGPIWKMTGKQDVPKVVPCGESEIHDDSWAEKT